MFDQSLNFKAHITNCTYYINLINVLSVTPWGSDRKTLLMIFEAYIVSRLQYGSQAFCCASSNQLKRLDVIYNKALCIAQVAICTPTESVPAELGKLPLTLRRIKQGNSTISYFYKFINDFGVAQLPISVEAGSHTKAPWQSQTPKVSFQMLKAIT